MADNTAKPPTPAYTTYAPLINFLNKFRDEGQIPLQVDKSHLRTASGSTIASHLQSMRFLKLIDANGKPLPLFEKFVMASDEQRKPILHQMLRDSYPYLFGDGFDLGRASGKMVEDRFKDQQIQGATVAKCMAFFLAAAKAADIKVSTAVKAPTRARPTKKQASTNGGAGAAANDEQLRRVDAAQHGQPKVDPTTHQQFHIPIRLGSTVTITVPRPWAKKDWDKFKKMLDLFIDDWDESQGAAGGAKTTGLPPDKEK